MSSAGQVLSAVLNSGATDGVTVKLRHPLNVALFTI